MKITKNSAKCIHCDEEVVSTHRHDFSMHFCKVKPAPMTHWEGNKIVDTPGETTFSFAVDGGHAYLRRVGSGFIDTSEGTDD